MATPRIPSLNWIRVFDAAAQTQSFSTAARLLNISASAVSQQIASLEQFLGEELFVRHPRSVTLTEAGYQFLPPVRAALVALESNVATIFAKDDRQPLSIEASTMFATSWLAPRVSKFLRLAPDVDLSIKGADGDAAERSGNMDIVIRFGPIEGQSEDELRLFGEIIFPVAVPDVAATISTPGDLLKQTLIDIPGHFLTWPYVLASLGIEGDLDLRRVRTSISDIAFAVAGAGGGIALARRPATEGLEAAYGLVPCLGTTEIVSGASFYAHLTEEGRRNPAAARFITWLASEAEH